MIHMQEWMNRQCENVNEWLKMLMLIFMLSISMMVERSGCSMFSLDGAAPVLAPVCARVCACVPVRVSISFLFLLPLCSCSVFRFVPILDWPVASPIVPLVVSFPVSLFVSGETVYCSAIQ